MDERNRYLRALSESEQGVRLSPNERRALRELLNTVENERSTPIIQAIENVVLSDGNPPFLNDPLIRQQLRNEPTMRVYRHPIGQCSGGRSRYREATTDSEDAPDTGGVKFPQPIVISTHGFTVSERGQLRVIVQNVMPTNTNVEIRVFNLTTGSTELLLMDNELFTIDTIIVENGTFSHTFGNVIPIQTPLRVDIKADGYIHVNIVHNDRELATF